MELKGCPEMSVTDYKSALHNIPEQQIRHSHHSGSSKSCMLNLSRIHTALASMTLNTLTLESTLFHLKHMDLIKQLPIIMEFLRKSDFHRDMKVTICLLFWWVEGKCTRFPFFLYL